MQMTDEIRELVASMVEAQVGEVLPKAPPNRVAIFAAEPDEDGKPVKAPTADGLVWRVDAPEWLATGEWVEKASEVRVPKPEPVAPKPKRRGRPPGSKNKPKPLPEE